MSFKLASIRSGHKKQLWVYVPNNSKAGREKVNGKLSQTLVNAMITMGCKSPRTSPSRTATNFSKEAMIQWLIETDQVRCMSIALIAVISKHSNIPRTRRWLDLQRNLVRVFIPNRKQIRASIVTLSIKQMTAQRGRLNDVHRLFLKWCIAVYWQCGYVLWFQLITVHLRSVIIALSVSSARSFSALKGYCWNPSMLKVFVCITKISIFMKLLRLRI